MAETKAKSVRWQLKEHLEPTEEEEEEEEGVLPPSSSSVLSDASLLSLSRVLGSGGLATCMCLPGLPTAVVVGALMSVASAGGQRDDSVAVAVTNSLLRHWKALKRTEAKKREMVRGLDRALRCSGHQAIAGILMECYLENRSLTDRCWK